MTSKRLNGLIAAVCTPLDENGNINEAMIPPIVEKLLQDGVAGFYICGSTGEGMSLATSERQMVAEAYIQATSNRIPVIIQVGHNSLSEAKQLAEHAQTAGADIVSATCPSYFKVSAVDGLVDCMSEIAASAPNLPFYYYHIPSLTGSTIEIVDFLEKGQRQIPNLTGLKYTDTKLFEFQECLELNDRAFDVVWGCDEMLLGAWATGAQGAIGSTYNIAAPLYKRIIENFSTGNLTVARSQQAQAVKMIRILASFPFHAAMKAVLEMQGLPVGRCRLPLEKLTAQDQEALSSELTRIGFFDWSQASSQ